VTRRCLLALLVALTSFGCSVNVSQTGGVTVANNQCSADSDCPGGECWNGVCVAHQGALSSVLLSLTPPASTPYGGVGGLGFLTVATQLVRSNEHDLDINGASVVHGYIRSACPFEVTLTPKEQSYGLATAAYVTVTSAAQTVAVACRDKLTISGDTQEFVADVPPGTFDVYIRPANSMAGRDGGAPDCGGVPEVFPGLLHTLTGVSCVSINQIVPRTLEVHIPWPSDAPTLEGWTLAVVHPITGQVLSQASAPLKGAPSKADDPVSYVQLVTYSPIASDASLAGQELLRLSPPPPKPMGAQAPVGPVLQFSVAAAIASSPAPASGAQKAMLPNIGPFPSKVNVETWVYRDADFEKGIETGVPSTVTFTATNLNLPGIFASYSTTAVVEPADAGHLKLDLLPGDYLVRVVPAVDLGNDVHLASQELSLTVRPSTGASGTVQAVRPLLVKDASVVTGRALAASGGGIAAASVQALPAATGTRRCTDVDAAGCSTQPVGVLEVSLAQAAYVPRSASAVTARDGNFVLSGVDCGGCDKGDGATFDIVVQPANGTRVPWLVWPQVTVRRCTRRCPSSSAARYSCPPAWRGRAPLCRARSSALMSSVTQAARRFSMIPLGYPAAPPARTPATETPHGASAPHSRWPRRAPIPTATTSSCFPPVWMPLPNDAARRTRAYIGTGSWCRAVIVCLP
jgi:hypothetical protein